MFKFNGKSIPEALFSNYKSLPDKSYLRFYENGEYTDCSFRMLWEESVRFAEYLKSCDTKTGVVLIFLPHSIGMHYSFYGSMLAGFIPSFMPCPSAKQHADVYWEAHVELLKRIQPSLIITCEPYLSQMKIHGFDQYCLKVVNLDDLESAPMVSKQIIGAYGRRKFTGIAFLQHSSGTTGLKKGVMLNHEEVIKQVNSYAKSISLEQDDVFASWLPVYHDMGLISCTVMPAILGNTVVFVDPFVWSSRPSILFSLIEQNKASFAWMPNFAFEHLVNTVGSKDSFNLSSMKAFISCSEPAKKISIERFINRFEAYGLKKSAVQVCYAMAETVFAVTQTTVGGRPSEIVLDRSEFEIGRVKPIESAAAEKSITFVSTGVVIDALKVKIKGTSRSSGDHVIGEVLIKGDCLFSGYYKLEQLTNERLVKGWYHTKDLGFISDGQLYITGRVDDLIIVNGKNLYAHEVEGLLLDIPGLKKGRAVAFGVPMQSVGSDGLVVVAEHVEGLDARQIQRVMAEVSTVIYDQSGVMPIDVRLMGANWLVKTTSGKISREKNRAKYLAVISEEQLSEVGLEDGEDASDVFTRLVNLIGRTFKFPVSKLSRETVAPDVRGWDSLGHTGLMIEVEREFGIAFDQQEVFGFNCVGDLADRVVELVQESVAGSTGRKSLMRTVYESDNCSIVRIGPETPKYEVVIFAGRKAEYGGGSLLDFASIFADSVFGEVARYYVTDRKMDWYVSAFDELVLELERICPREKFLMGASMGGFAAIRFSKVLSRVRSVLSFVPQGRIDPRRVPYISDETLAYRISPKEKLRYDIIFGSLEDESHKIIASENFTDKNLHYFYKVQNCGHTVVSFLHRQGLLHDVVRAFIFSKRPEVELEQAMNKIPYSAEDEEKYFRRLEIVRVFKRFNMTAREWMQAKPH